MTLRRMLLVAVMGALWVGAGACMDTRGTALAGGEDCTNGIDDNEDLLIDCEDPECIGHAACLPMSEFDCENGIDDDGDGQVDCTDSDCHTAQGCNPNTEVNCADGADNDGDGLTDCDDPDCFESELCCCAGGEDCTNGVDDDGDGLTDCDDPDCEPLPICADVERCDNGVDDDGDGLTDCDDADCDGNPWCMELQCADGLDNDDDGFFDCDDTDCLGQPGCIASTDCTPAPTISCYDYFEDSTVGRLSNFSSYSCATGSFPGGERYYELTGLTGQSVTIWISDFSSSQDLQLLVLAPDSGTGGCNPAEDCAAADITAGSDDSVSIGPDGVTSIWVVVDGRSAAGGAFDLYVSCETPVETNCDNGIDDDGDGAIDCVDYDCMQMPACSAETHCSDGIDNDADGATDCWDTDCAPLTLCDYWADAGEDCTSFTGCIPDAAHTCLTVPNAATGFCSRECTNVGGADTLCDNPLGIQGLCIADLGGTGGYCVFPCGTNFPGHSCPTGWTCTNPDPVNNPGNGICTP